MTDTQVNITLGAKAKALLEDETLNKAFAAVDELFIERWKTSTDAAERDRCWMGINIAAQVRSALGVFVDNGKVSQSDLDAILAQEKAA